MDFLRKVPEEKRGLVPTYPALTLGLHVAGKGAQIGSVAGLGLTTLTAVACTLVRRKRPQAWKIIMVPSTIVGTSFTCAMLYFKHMNNELDDAAVDDRAQRIANNTEQIKTDRYSLAGFSIGAVLGVIAGQNIAAMSCTGIAAGVLFYFAEREKNDAKKRKAMEVFNPRREE